LFVIFMRPCWGVGYSRRSKNGGVFGSPENNVALDRISSRSTRHKAKEGESLSGKLLKPGDPAEAC
jgi:hypothetical protein